MFTKHRAATAKFYNEPPKEEELYSGFLHKSPDFSGITKGKGKAWRRRFFVLSKMDENTYYLTYYRNEEKKHSLRKIDLSMVRLIFTRPDKHQMWDWIQKNFRCSPASVLFLRVDDCMPKSARDYFLIGENSEDVDKWEKELLKVKSTLGNVCLTDNSLQDSRDRSKTEPPPKSPPCDEVSRLTDPNRLSEPVFSWTMPESHYAVPRSYQMPACKVADDACSDDDDDDYDDDDTEENPETPEDNTDYMDMASVQKVLLENKHKEDACIQTNASTKAVCNAEDNQEKNSPMRRNSADLICSKGSLPDFNGNCASTERKKSETPIEKEICIHRNDLNESLTFTQERGKLCVSECKQTETSHMFQKGDQILAFNDLLIDSAEDIQKYLRRLSKDEVKLTILRYPESRPFRAESCLTH